VRDRWSEGENLGLPNKTRERLFAALDALNM